MELAILICKSPQSSDWELPLRDCLLIGWIVRPESFEGGAPWPVRHLLSQALCKTATVSYLAHDGEPVPRSKHKIVTTTEPTVAAALFDDPAYPWTQRGQAAFLSDEAPAISAKLLTEVVGQRNPLAAERAGFKGVLLPGVDGAVAGLWIFDAAELDVFIETLRASAEVYLLSEDDFRVALTTE
jgi:hypothetical protein